MIGLSSSATAVAGAFNAHTFGSLKTAAIAIATVVFQAALLVNQLAQVSEARHARRARHVAQGPPADTGLDRR
jgi:hypothetical protein